MQIIINCLYFISQIKVFLHLLTKNFSHMRIRSLLFAASVIAAFSFAFAQESEAYKPFVKPGKTWRYKLVDDYAWWSEDGKGGPDDLMDISIGQPVQIDSAEWHPVYLRQYSKNPTDSVEPFGYLKEDLDAKIVYWKANEENQYNHNVALNYPASNILYDFDNGATPEFVWLGYPDKGWIEFEGVKYYGFVNQNFDIILVERLGLVDKTDVECKHGTTIFGFPPLPAGAPGYLYIPYIYEVTDGEGNILYQKEMNRPSNSLADERNDAMAIRVTNSQVVFTGIPGRPLEIINMQGMTMWQGQTDSAGRAISTPLPKGCYVVKHGTHATKVIVNQ